MLSGSARWGDFGCRRQKSDLAGVGTEPFLLAGRRGDEIRGLGQGRLVVDLSGGNALCALEKTRAFILLRKYQR